MGTIQLHVDQQIQDEKNPMEEDHRQRVCGGGDGGCGGGEERAIWLGSDHQQEDDLLDVNDPSIFYADFPPLPDFTCMSSTSSSSSTPAGTVKAVATSSSSSSASSSTASWAVLKSDADDDVQKENQSSGGYDQNQQSTATAALTSTGSMEIPQTSDQGGGSGGGDGTIDCMDVMENFGYMDLIDDNDFFDPSSIFNPEDNFLYEFQQHDQHQNPPLEQPPEHSYEQMMMQIGNGGEPCGGECEPQVNSSSDDLAMVFLEWLKSNKDSVSAEDLRRVKIKKATIESAAKRLGGGKEAMKQLLKLILEWVQTNHLQKRKMKESALQNPNPTHDHNPLASNPSLNCNSNSISISIQPDHQPNIPCFTHSPWMAAAPSYVAADPAGSYSPMAGYPYGNGAPNMTGYPDSYHMLESAQSWPPTQFAMASSHYNSYPDPVQTHPPDFTGYGSQYPCQYMQGQQVGDGRLVRLGSSATKEARKKRMARQRRFIPHHRNHNHQQNDHQNQSAAPAAADGHHAVAQQKPGNWVYWQHSGQDFNPGAGSTSPIMPVDAPPVERAGASMQPSPNHPGRQAGSDKRQNWKPEKNLRFLLQKVLKQSDVGTLGRIVLPKKEAETHLPELEARDGISIAMEDIGTSRVWNMRYRFWPNNKSRMYLLENTGDFVRTNGLQEGDFIVIYSDIKCGKYLIRGVKVRQGGGGTSATTTKGENKKGSVKSQKNTAASSPAGGQDHVNQKVK